MLNIAREKAKLISAPINFILCDMDNMPFNDNSFDAVISITALEFSKNPKNTLK
jgi:ubiquinone/menaquinone biosynthesis C-methylase UbiE